MNVIQAADVEFLMITGLRDEAPLAAFSHLVLDSLLIEVRVQATDYVRDLRRGI